MTSIELKDRLITEIRESRRLFERNAVIYQRLANKQYSTEREAADLAREMGNNLKQIGRVNDRIDTWLVNLDALEKVDA